MNRNITKKVVALLMAVTMVVGLVPLGSAKVLGEEAKKAYEMIVEPTMVYEFVYGFNHGISPVKDENGNWGAIDTSGKEIIECKYKGVYPIAEDKILVADLDSNWYMLNDLGEVLYSYGNHYLVECYGENTLGVREDSSGWEASYYMDIEGDRVEGYENDSFHLIEDSLYNGKYYLACKWKHIGDAYKKEYGLIEAETQSVVREYKGFSEMWVSEDDTKLIGKNVDGKYVEIDCGSKVIVQTYEGYEELWGSKYDHSILFGKTENKDYVMLNTKGEVLYNYGNKKIEEVLQGYLQQGTNIMKYDGTIVIKDFEYNFVPTDATGRAYLYEGKYFLAKKGIETWDGMEYTYYLLDIDGNVVKDYGKNRVEFLNGYTAESKGDGLYSFGKFDEEENNRILISDFFIGDVIILKPTGEGFTFLNMIDGKKLSTEYCRVKGYLGVRDMMVLSTFNINRNDKFKGLFILYNNSELMNTIYYYNYYYTDVNLLYDGKMLFEKDELEAIGKFDERDGYLPIKKEGKWGVIKINSETNYSDEILNDEQPSTPEQTTAPEQITTINEETTVRVEKSTRESGLKNNSIVKAPSIAKISAITQGKKKVSLKFKKVKDAKGYLIQYSTKKNFKGAKKKYTTKTKVTIKKLKSKKIYYFRIKAYKLNGKKKVYSKKWSKVKKVEVK